ncbi:MAG: homoserine dehydrogenase, partial [Victivallales bacterium]|nr:homoserine dehydrogenase [Victivallales bacterium]
DIQVVVELIGGTTFAKTIIQRAIEHGKSVVTANKALIATYGEELFTAAAAKGVDIGFEASVGGGIPCIKALREGLAANHIRQIYGILNGTCNYILTKMENDQADFENVLAAAQKNGYAEANPALDVDGIDTAHKTAVLASLAYGKWFTVKDITTEGIRNVTLTDIECAARLGYKIKLLATIKSEGPAIELGVHPALVPAASLLGNVSDVFNAVWVEGDVVGKTMYYGRGAGRQATASAVVADIVDIGLNLCNGCSRRIPAFPCYADGVSRTEFATRYYIRLLVEDKPGVLAKVGGVLASHNISLSSVSQDEGGQGQGKVPMILLTHQANGDAMSQATQELSALPEVHASPVVFRIEDAL